MLVSWPIEVTRFHKTSRKYDARLYIKLGRGQGDGDIGTLGTCDSGTRDEGLGDIKYETRGDVRDGDVGRQIQRRGGLGDVNEYCESRR